MKLIVLSLLLHSVFVALATPGLGPHESNERCVIKGRVVDTTGRPVSNALVTVDLVPGEGDEGMWEKVTPSYETDSEGRFSIEVEFSVERPKRMLYVTSPIPKNSFTPLHSPFHELRGGKWRSLGKALVLKAVDKIDLGDIPVQVWYRLITLRPLTKLGQPYRVSTTEVQQWCLWARLRDQSLDVVSESSLPEKAIDRGSGNISIALPEGRWRLSMADRCEGDAYGPDLVLDLSGKNQLESYEYVLSPSSQPSSSHTPDLRMTNASAREELSQMGVSVSSDSLIERAEKRNYRAVLLLLEAGIDVNRKNSDGTTALVAAAGRSPAIVELLIRRGARVNDRARNGATALIAAAGTATTEGTESVVLLLRAGANAEAATDDGITALMIAAANSHASALEPLLNAGAVIDRRDNAGKTAIDWAKNNPRILELLKHVKQKAPR